MMIGLWFNLAFATPADLPSGECANDPQSGPQATGKELYNTHCGGCHQADGSGEKGYFPPVVGTPWVEDASALTSVLFRGVSGTILVNGERYASYMSPYGKDLSDEDILQIIHYVRHSLNAYPEDSSFSTDSIATIRAASK